MTFPARPPLTDGLTHVSDHARLPLSPDRHVPVSSLLTGALALIDRLDDLDLAEIPPATAFDARWE